MLVNLSYLVSASLFLVGIKKLGTPPTARAGNLLAALGMLLAIVVTLLHQGVLNLGMVLAGMVAGGLIGAVMARKVEMTAMPQLVAAFNGFGGGASALIAAAEYSRLLATGGSLIPTVTIAAAFGTIVGTLTFSGSLIAFGKLQEILSGRPVTFRLQQPLSLVLLLTLAAVSVMFVLTPGQTGLYLTLLAIPMVMGILAVIRIGGADMPVVISLLNSLSGLAAAAAGFVIGNPILIIAGALVGAAGFILTQIMAKAMNRPINNILFGAFGGQTAAADGDDDRVVRSVSAEDAATVLAFARSVIFVPGYGLAVAQAQHNVAELAGILEARGTEVKYAIHPVAGRMPGHMNVLLAEANIPYTKLKDLDEINNEFERTDIAVVIGANDVTNPAARSDQQSPLYGMPILNVDQSRSILVLKRGMGAGFAGVENELFFDEKTMMLFGDAKESVVQLTHEVKSM